MPMHYTALGNPKRWDANGGLPVGPGVARGVANGEQTEHRRTAFV